MVVAGKCVECLVAVWRLTLHTAALTSSAILHLTITTTRTPQVQNSNTLKHNSVWTCHYFARVHTLQPNETPTQQLGSRAIGIHMPVGTSFGSYFRRTSKARVHRACVDYSCTCHTVLYMIHLHILQSVYVCLMSASYSNVLRISTTLSPTSFVLCWPPRSAVLNPAPPLSVSSKTFLTASSIAFAGFSIPKEYLNNMAALRIVPIGFAMPCPAMSGAEPCIGSYRPGVGVKLGEV